MMTVQGFSEALPVEGKAMLKRCSISISVIQRYSPGNCRYFNALCCHHKLGGCLTVVLAWGAGTGLVAALDKNRTDGS